MREARLAGVVLLLLLSHVSGLFTFSSFDATPIQDVIRGVDFNPSLSCSACHSSTTERQATIRLKKLIIIKKKDCQMSEQLSATWKQVWF